MRHVIRRSSSCCLAALMALSACTGTGPPPSTSSTTTSTPSTTLLGPSAASVVLTTGDRSRLLSHEQPILVSGYAGQPVDITVDATVTYQPFEGAGAALTDSSAWLMMNRLSASSRESLLADLFGPTGASLSYLRVPTSSSDFSTSDYTYNDLQYPLTDPGLVGFSMAREDVATVPILQRAKAINPNLKLMGSAWSAPGWMKTGNNPLLRKGLIGGTLRSEYVGTYARYLRLVAEGFAARGLPLSALTVQNEPGYAPGDYPGMLLSPSLEASLARAASLELANLPSPPKVLVHDHNWDLAARADQILADPAAAPHVDGVAFHCYGGNPEQQRSVNDSGTPVYFTECTGTFSSGTFSSNLLWNTNQLAIGSVRYGARTVLLWNIALDQSGGPRVGGCGDCRGVVTIQNGQVLKNEEYYALAHLSRAAPPGSYRVGSSEGSGSLKNVAFRDSTGGRGLLLSNDGAVARTVRVRDGGRFLSYTLPAQSIATIRWDEK